MTTTNCSSVRDLYLDLLKRSLTNWIHGHEEFILVEPTPIRKILAKQVYPKGTSLVKVQRFDEQKRMVGQDWPTPLLAHTMIGMKRLDNLQMCIEQVIADNVPGDFIETGVWKGGSTIFMRGALKAFDDATRRVWVADSFQGLPPPNTSLYPDDAGDIHFTIDSLKISLEQVKENFAAYGLLDDRVVFLKGWFSETLPSAPIDQLSVLRLDGDMYESTMDALNNLYSKLTVGGYIIIDDYCIQSCMKAVADFRRRMSIFEPIVDIDGTGVFWRRTA
jgi:O-methyltransferase